MVAQRHDDAHPKSGASWTTAASIAERWVVPRAQVNNWCREGLLRGAWFDRQTWQWRVPLPIVATRTSGRTQYGEGRRADGGAAMAARAVLRFTEGAA